MGRLWTSQVLKIQNFAKVKCTEWKNVKRVKFVENIDDPAESARRLLLKEELLKVTDKYIANNCQKDGKLKESNLTNDQEKSLNVFKKRVENENLCVYETDKTGKFVVDKVENMKSKMQVHLENDKILDKKQTAKIEKLLNDETRNWIEIMNIGNEVNQKKRTVFNLVSTDNPIPILRGTAKDHKVLKEPERGHELRPIMGARIGPNHSLAQIGSKFLRAIAESVKETKVVRSTEELLRKL